MLNLYEQFFSTLFILFYFYICDLHVTYMLYITNTIHSCIISMFDLPEPMRDDCSKISSNLPLFLVINLIFHLSLFRAAFSQYMWPVCQTRYTSREKYPRKTPFFDTIWVLFVDVSKTPKGSDMVGHGRTFRSFYGHIKLAVI